MTDNNSNISTDNLEYINKLVEREREREAKEARAAQQTAAFNEAYEKIAGDEKYKAVRNVLEEVKSERDYTRFGAEGMELLMERANMKIERMKAAESTKQTNTGTEGEGPSIDRQTPPSTAGEPDQEGDVPMKRQHVIDFTKVKDEQIDPAIHRTAQRIRGLQSRSKIHDAWRDGTIE